MLSRYLGTRVVISNFINFAFIPVEIGRKMNELTETKLFYKSVYFDLPFLIFVKDGFRDKELEDWAKAYSEGNKDLPFSRYAPSSNEQGFMAIGGGFPVYLPPEDIAEAYVIKTNDVYVGLQFLKRINQNNPAKLCGEIIGDRTGRASFSSVRVNFDLHQFQEKAFWNIRLFVKLAIDAVNRFIENYRAIADRFYIRPVTPQVIQNFTIFNEFTDGTSATQTYSTDKSTLLVPNDDSGNEYDKHLSYFMDARLHGMGGAITDEHDDSLRHSLSNDIQPHIIETLRLEVQDKLDLREWRLASIESAILFETFINIFLRHVYRSLGITEGEIEDKFYKPDKNRTPFSAYSIAKTIIKDAIGYDFENTIEFNNWSTYTGL